jgi:hypothetical protein
MRRRPDGLIAATPIAPFERAIGCQFRMFERPLNQPQRAVSTNQFEVGWLSPR